MCLTANYHFQTILFYENIGAYKLHMHNIDNLTQM